MLVYGADYYSSFRLTSASCLLWRIMGTSTFHIPGISDSIAQRSSMELQDAVTKDATGGAGIAVFTPLMDRTEHSFSRLRARRPLALNALICAANSLASMLMCEY